MRECKVYLNLIYKPDSVVDSLIRPCRHSSGQPLPRFSNEFQKPHPNPYLVRFRAGFVKEGGAERLGPHAFPSKGGVSPERVSVFVNGAEMTKEDIILRGLPKV